jgi:hypothetical protein
VAILWVKYTKSNLPCKPLKENRTPAFRPQDIIFTLGISFFLIIALETFTLFIVDREKNSPAAPIKHTLPVAENVLN